MFAESSNVHTFPFCTHSFNSCFLNKTPGASWRVAVCRGVQEAKPKHIFIMRARSLLLRVLTSALPEHTDPTLLEVSNSPDYAVTALSHSADPLPAVIEIQLVSVVL